MAAPNRIGENPGVRRALFYGSSAPPARPALRPSRRQGPLGVRVAGCIQRLVCGGRGVSGGLPGSRTSKGAAPSPAAPCPVRGGRQGQNGIPLPPPQARVAEQTSQPWPGTRAAAVYRLKMDRMPASPPALAGASGSSALLPASFSATWRNPLPAGLLTGTGLPSTRARCRSSGA